MSTQVVVTPKHITVDELARALFETEAEEQVIEAEIKGICEAPPSWDEGIVRGFYHARAVALFARVAKAGTLPTAHEDYVSLKTAGTRGKGE